MTLDDDNNSNNNKGGRSSTEDGECYTYITSNYEQRTRSSNNDKYPKPLNCDSKYGIWRTHSSYTDSSCCSDDGIYFIETGQSGGFDFTFEYPETTLCSLYTKAMTGIVCNPNQGRFISNNTLRVCSSTCQTLFDNCGLPGVNFPKWTTYTDAISLCKEAWGGFGIYNPCDARPNGYACQSEILGVEVVVNGVEGVDCLGIVPPTPQEIKEYENNPFANIEYKCSSSSSSTNAVIIGSVVGGVVLFGGLCFGLLLWRSKRNRKRMEGEGVVVSMGEEDHRQQSVEVVVEKSAVGCTQFGTPVPVPVASASVLSSSSAFPVATAVRFDSMQHPTAPPQPVDDDENDIIGEGVTTNVLHDNDSTQHELTFDQMLDNKYSHLQIK